jgi:hypothetical protein
VGRAKRPAAAIDDLVDPPHREDAAVVLRQYGQIGYGNLQQLAEGTVAFTQRAVTGGAILVVLALAGVVFRGSGRVPCGHSDEHRAEQRQMQVGRVHRDLLKRAQ